MYFRKVCVLTKKSSIQGSINATEAIVIGSIDNLVNTGTKALNCNQ